MCYERAADEEQTLQQVAPIRQLVVCSWSDPVRRSYAAEPGQEPRLHGAAPVGIMDSSKHCMIILLTRLTIEIQPVADI
jgi:hypothetical protein